MNILKPSLCSVKQNISRIAYVRNRLITIQIWFVTNYCGRSQRALDACEKLLEHISMTYSTSGCMCHQTF